jgi:nucleoid-associated protein YgaU
MNRKLFGFLLILLLLATCSKEVVEQEPVVQQPAPEQKAPPVETPQPVQAPLVIVPAEPETLIVDTVTTVETDTAVAPPEILKETEGKLEEVLEIISEGDSVDIFYMIKPGDYLSLIALQEYDKLGMWRLIYKWNRKKIGQNPNLIYPFHELLLKKPKEIANDLEYEFYDYTVKANESLWGIAGKEYKNHYAWIVILRDNADVVGSNLEDIPTGTVLKLRTNLFN